MKGNIKPFAALSSLYCQDNQITAELPYRPTWPTQEEITIVPVNSEATVSTPTTTDGGKTWTFTVTSKDGPSSQAYTISVTILPHVHEWEKTWTWNETPHWYGCASAICPGIQEDAEKGSCGVHIYDQQVAAQEYLATGATCTAPAECYVSCICGKAGTETFSSGEALGHDWAETIYTWSDDSAACTTSRTCSRDQSHTEIAVAAVGILGISVYGKQKKRKSHAFRLSWGLCRLWKGIVPAILSRGTERLICHLHHLSHSP